MEAIQKKEVATEPIIPDGLLRQIIDAGQVDVLVATAVPDGADSVSGIVLATRAAFRTFYPRLRTALLVADRGAREGSAAAARLAWDAAAYYIRSEFCTSDFFNLKSASRVLQYIAPHCFL